MKTNLIKASAVGIAAALALSACAAEGASEAGDQQIDLVGFSVLETVNESVVEAFGATDAGKGVKFAPSYGASGDQSRAVEAGQDADLVHLSLEPDVTRLVDAGLVADDWKAGPTKGIGTSSVVVFVVREGNPEGIEAWEDLAKPGVEIITPHPGSSGSAKWNILAAWGSQLAQGKSEKDAETFTKQLIGNTIKLPSSARDATSAFVDQGQGDVLLSYENEAILGRQAGSEIDYVVPPQTLLIENPVALTKDAGAPAEALYDFLHTEEAQTLYAQSGFRPVGVDVQTEVEGANDPANPFPAPSDKLLTVDGDFGGWAEADAKYFDEENGIIIKLLNAAGKPAEE